ncbi:MAG: hypothetical protein ACK56I_17155, partial [bacterium]
LHIEIGGAFFRFAFDDKTTVVDLRAMIEDRTSVPSALSHLSFRTKPLNPADCLAALGIGDVSLFGGARPGTRSQSPTPGADPTGPQAPNRGSPRAFAATSRMPGTPCRPAAPTPPTSDAAAPEPTFARDHRPAGPGPLPMP